MTTVLIDENLSEFFAEGLHLMQSPLENGIEVTSVAELFQKGAKDEEWIQALG